MFTFSVVVVDLPTDCILSFLFPAATDVLVPVFSQSTDVVVVNSVVVLNFPIIIKTSANSSVCLLSRWQESALSPLTSSLRARPYACVKAVFTNFRSFFSFIKVKSTEINQLWLTEGISECIYLQLRRFLGNFHVNVLGPILFLIDIYDLSDTIQKTVVNILQ